MTDILTSRRVAEPHVIETSPWRLWIGLGVMLCGTFMTIMDVFIVNVAIPSIRQDLSASFAEVQFIIAGYALTYAIARITGGRLGDVYGRRRMFMVGLAGFTVASSLCGIAPTSAWLVATRLLQGGTAAILFPQVFALIRVIFVDARQRSIAFSTMGFVLGLACIVGQLIGGLLVEANLWGLAWRLVFLINIPIGLVAFVAAPFVIDESHSPSGRTMDLAGVLLSALGLGLLLFPLVEGRELGWPAWSFTMLAASVPVLAIFAIHQHRKSLLGTSPLLETSLFRDRAFAVGILIVLIFYSTLNSIYLSLALLIQIGLARSPVHSGLILASNALAFMVSSIVAGRLPQAWGRSSLIAGAAIAAVASLIAAATARSVAPLHGEELIPALVLWGVGQGLLMTPLLNTIVGGVHAHNAGSAAGMLSTMQQVGGALGVAVVGILFFSRLDHAHLLGQSEPSAYADAFMAAVLYGAGGAAVTCALLHLLPKKTSSPSARS